MGMIFSVLKEKGEPMIDLIRRDDVIKAIKPIVATLPLGYHSEFASALNSIPSAEPKVGRWIKLDRNETLNESYTCSQCGYRKWVSKARFLYEPKSVLNYCPNCGARMEIKTGNCNLSASK